MIELSPLRGIIVPMVTPLRNNGRLDAAGLERLVEHILAGGVQGLFVLGTTGEGPQLPYALRQELLRQTCRLVAGRVPVLAGITDTVLAESLRLAGIAADAGAAAVVAAPPYYFPADQDELIRYYQLLAGASPLPLFLYNMPSHTKVSIEPETVKVLADHPRIAGLKDSSGSMVNFELLVRALQHRPDFSLLVGPEELTAATVLLGGHGGVNGGANLFPALYVALYRAAAAQDLERVAVLHGQVMEISARLYAIGRSQTRYLKGLKAALALKGLCHDALAEPHLPFRGKEKRQVQTFLHEFKPVKTQVL